MERRRSLLISQSSASLVRDQDLPLIASSNSFPGAPGAGKGTLCSFLAQKHSLYHFSIGDHLRQLAREFPDGHLAVKIQSILKDQTSLPFEDIKVLLEHALEHAMSQGKFKGILLDGYPRYMDQVQPFNAWLEENVDNGSLAIINARRRPDLVLRFDVEKEIALNRFLSREREPTDDETFFERRYASYERETLEVFEEYRNRSVNRATVSEKLFAVRRSNDMRG